MLNVGDHQDRQNRAEQSREAEQRKGGKKYVSSDAAVCFCAAQATECSGGSKKTEAAYLLRQP